jgi:hypothetical protein
VRTLEKKRGEPEAAGGAIAVDGAGGTEVTMAAPLDARPPGGLDPGLVPLEAATPSQS